MKKKRILIVDYQFCLGGVGIAALNFIENIRKEFNIELLLIKSGGELENRLPKDIIIHYVPEDISDFILSRRDYRKKHNLKERFVRAYYGILSRLNCSKGKMTKLAKEAVKDLGHFDLVINNDMDAGANSLGGLCHPISLYGIDSDKKFLVIHGDFLANDYDKKFFRREYLKYDKILSVTESLNNQMISIFPDVKDKFCSLLNFQDCEGIITLSNKEKIIFDNNKVNLVSASRLVELKGYLRTLKVLKKLKEEGINNFVWHILGDGTQREDIEKFISDNDMCDNIKLYGVVKNPYPYFKAADIVMLNSYHESYGLVLIESMIVGTPAFTTRTISAEEIVKNNGWVVENSEQGIYNGLKEILCNRTLIKNKKQELKSFQYDNQTILNKFKGLL